MINPQLQTEILRLHHAEKWPVGTIARQLGLHHSTVRRVIDADGKPPEAKKRASKVDPYLPFMKEMLEKYPRLTASRLYHMVCERGYEGKPSHFRDIVAKIRPSRTREAYLRLRTLPGDQGQVDWGHFGRLEVGRATRPLVAFVMVLSYSRAIFLRFFLSQSLGPFLRAHAMAFEHFGERLPRVILYDNLKSVVLERTGRAIRFNQHFLSFSSYYRFEPRPVAVARGNEKGRVERAIGYVRTSFFQARRYADLDDLNRQAEEWSTTVAMERRWPEDKRLSVREAFEHEKEKLIAVPPYALPCEDRLETTIGKTPYVRFDLNDYSVPHTVCRKPIVLLASEEKIRILHDGEIVAEHVRSYDRDGQIEDLAHIEKLREHKSAASRHDRVHLLAKAAPSSTQLVEILAERGEPLGRATRQLLELLRTYGAEPLDAALREAIDAEAPHVQAVQHILERNRREAGRPPPRPLVLPDDPRISGVVVTPHELSKYDRITKEVRDDETNGE